MGRKEGGRLESFVSPRSASIGGYGSLAEIWDVVAVVAVQIYGNRQPLSLPECL